MNPPMDHKAQKTKPPEISSIIADLKEEKLFSETVLNSLPGIFYLYDIDDNLIRWNKNHEVLTGFTAEELSKKSMLEWFEGEDKDRVEQTVADVKKNGNGEVEAHLLIKNGDKIPYYFTGTSMTVGGQVYMMGVGIDLTEQKKVEYALRRSEEKYREIFENSVEGIFQATPPGKFVSANPSAAKILGYDSPEDLMENLSDIESQLYVRPEKRQEFLKIMKEKKEISGFEVQFFRKDKSIIWAALYARGVYDAAGKFQLIEGIFSDITEQKHATDALKQENIRLRSGIKDRYKFEGIIGKSTAMQEVYELILSASASGANVIVYGESGTGKELVARAIHGLSERRDKRFVAINCGAISENLLESEFFGYKKGAFTGAATDKKGYLDLANEGTLFLDELGEISLNLQVKLLRVIEDGGYRPVGGKTMKKSNIRIIAATNQNLQEHVHNRLIREDFYYRIHVLPIYLPPLRDKKEDIPLLIDHFLNPYRGNDRVPPMTGEMIETLLKYNWPGNVRELQNVLQRYVSLKRIDLSGGVGIKLSSVDEGEAFTDMPETENFKDTVDQFEKRIIMKALENNKWHREKAAQALSIPRRTFFRKIKKFGLI